SYYTYDVYETDYVFQLPSGEVLEGTSVLIDDPLRNKSTNDLFPDVECVNSDYYYPNGTDPVVITIEYNAHNPTQNRVQGTVTRGMASRVAIVTLESLAMSFLLLCCVGAVQKKLISLPE